ncbi:MAG: type II toxin-antitoxin system PemK/MazF family toxin [archaeon]
MKGKIVLIPFPFTDLSSAKLRPALVLYEGRRDVVVAFISSRVPDKIDLARVRIGEDDKEFPLTGLKKKSVIRLDKLATVLKDMIVGEIGIVGEELKKNINEKLNSIYSL